MEPVAVLSPPGVQTPPLCWRLLRRPRGAPAPPPSFTQVYLPMACLVAFPPISPPLKSQENA